MKGASWNWGVSSARTMDAVSRSYKLKLGYGALSRSFAKVERQDGAKAAGW